MAYTAIFPKMGLFGSIMAKPLDRKSGEWSQKLLLGPLSTADVYKMEGLFHPQKPSARRNGSNEKVKPIALTLQNNLKGFIFKIVLFDQDSIFMYSVNSNVPKAKYQP